MNWVISPKWQMMGVAVVARLYRPVDRRGLYFGHIKASIAAREEWRQIGTGEGWAAEKAAIQLVKVQPRQLLATDA
jgi:hypothetical protein